MIISNILKPSPFTKINRSLVRSNVISTRLAYSTINNLKINDPLYKRQNDKNLPSRTNPLSPMIALSIFAFLTWGVFVQFSNNSERLNSSVVKELMRQSKFHPVTREILGNNIKPSSSDYPFLLNGLLGSTWVKGSISLMQGKVDISLRLEGSKGMLYYLPFCLNSFTYKYKFFLLMYRKGNNIFHFN